MKLFLDFSLKTTFYTSKICHSQDTMCSSFKHLITKDAVWKVCQLLSCVLLFARLQLARFLCPGKNTVVGCHSLFQGIFLTQGLNLGLLNCRQILYHLSHWHFLILHCEFIIHFTLRHLLLSIGMTLSPKDWIHFILGLLLLWVLILSI